MFYNADSGLYMTNYRAYDPTSGRWLSRDPLGEVTDPAGNLYPYAAGDPANATDVSGLSVHQRPRLPNPFTPTPCPGDGAGNPNPPNVGATQMPSGQQPVVIAGKARRSVPLFCQNVVCGAPTSGTYYPLCPDCNTRLKNGEPAILLETGQKITVPIEPEE